MSKINLSIVIYLLTAVFAGVLLIDNSMSLLVCVLLGISLLYAMFLFAMAMLIRLNFFLKAVNTNNEQQIVLTFDDGPHPEHTISILDILDELNVKAVFFMIGKYVKAYPEIAKEVSRRGHQIGVHSQNHSAYFGMLTATKLANELQDCTAEIETATGVKPHLFRPPFGITNPSIAKVTLVQKLITIGWSVRSFDTVTKSADKLRNRVLSKVKGNSIILLHDRLTLTVEALPSIIHEIRGNGLEFGQLTIFKKI